MLADSRLGNDQAHGLMSIIFRVAAGHQLDVKVTAVNSPGAAGWTPRAPLSMSDYQKSITEIFQDSKDRARQTRVDDALSSFDKYFERLNEAGGRSCTSLVTAARQIAGDASPYNLLMIRDSVCALPQVTLRLPSERKLLVIVAQQAGTEEEQECSELARMRQISKAFPNARFLTAGVTSKDVEDALFHEKTAAPAKLHVHGCDNVQPSPAAVAPAAFDPPVVAATAGLRIISPRSGASGPRLVPFHGDGAQPGELLVPIVQVGDEFWPQEFIRANSDGTFNGAVIIGRPWRDCGQIFTLRIFSQVNQPVRVGIPAYGSWPAGERPLSRWS